MIRNLSLGILLFVYIVSMQAQTKNNQTPLTKHKAYKAGESLTYNVRYGFISGGAGHFSITDSIIDGTKVDHVVVKGVTTGLADAIFKVRDVYESYIDVNTNLPVKAIRNIREGRYRYYDEITYLRDSAMVHTTKNGKHKVPDKALDVVSAFYFARNHIFNDQLKKDETIELVTFFAGKVYPLRIRYRGLETIQTKFGKMECYLFSPITEVGRAFKTEDDMQVWISRDGNRLPVKIRFNLVVGSFVCELSEFRGLKYPFSSIRM